MKNKYYNNNVKTGEIPLKSDNRDDVLKWIYDVHIVEWYTTYLMRKPIEDEDVADIVQELFLMICEVPEEKWKELYMQGQYAVSAYVTGIVHQQVMSNNSVVYKKYTKYREIQPIKDELFWIKYDEENGEY